MEITTTTYVRLVIPDGTFSKAKTFEVEHRDPYKVATPQEVFAFQFHDIHTVEREIDGQTVELSSEESNVSPLYIIRGKVLNLAQIENQYPQHVSAIKNARKYGNQKLIKVGTDYFPLQENMELLKDYRAITNNGQDANGKQQD